MSRPRHTVEQILTKLRKAEKTSQEYTYHLPRYSLADMIPILGNDGLVIVSTLVRIGMNVVTIARGRGQ